eukprot:5218741-Alexandrium_andersonii.AAC.1
MRMHRCACAQCVCVCVHVRVRLHVRVRVSVRTFVCVPLRVRGAPVDGRTQLTLEGSTSCSFTIDGEVRAGVGALDGLWVE